MSRNGKQNVKSMQTKWFRNSFEIVNYAMTRLACFVNVYYIDYKFKNISKKLMGRNAQSKQCGLKIAL